MGVCGQLFVEHNSGVNGLIAGSIVLYTFIKKVKGKRTLSLSYLLSTITGFGIMLVIPKIYEGEHMVDIETYRGLHLENAHDLIVSIVNNAVDIMIFFTNTWFLNVSIIILICWLILKSKNVSDKIQKSFNILLVITILCFFVLTITKVIFKNAHYLFSILPTALIYLIFITTALFYIKEIKHLILFAFAIISFLPLLIVFPIGPRTFAFGYFIITVLIVDIYNITFSALKNNISFGKALTSLCFVLLCLLIIINGKCKYLEQIRIDYIEDQINASATEIEVFHTFGISS